MHRLDTMSVCEAARAAVGMEASREGQKPPIAEPNRQAKEEILMHFCMTGQSSVSAHGCFQGTQPDMCSAQTSRIKLSLHTLAGHASWSRKYPSWISR